MLDYYSTGIAKAKQEGIDIVEFARQGDTGTVVINQDSVVRNIDNHKTLPKASNSPVQPRNPEKGIEIPKEQTFAKNGDLIGNKFSDGDTNYEVIAIDPNKYGGKFKFGLQKDNGFVELYQTKDDIISFMEKAKKREAKKKTELLEEAKQKEINREAKESYENINGFADTQSSMQKANTLKILNSQINYNGEMLTRKKAIELNPDNIEKVDYKRDAYGNDTNVKLNKPEYRLYKDNKKSVYQNISKTEYDYAQFLKGKLNRELPKAPI